jgi:hypothetical protein
MAVNVPADLNERRGVTARRASLALFALAVSVAVPFAPARAVVPAAPAWAHPAEVNQPVIKVEWGEQKARRRGRPDAGGGCIEHDSRPSCLAAGCKWQKGTVLHPGEGYCYPPAIGVNKPFGGHKPQ